MKFRRRLNFAVVAVCAAFATAAHAGLTIDQSQTRLDPSGRDHAIGGDVEQKLAQTFKVGTGGPLAAIAVPVSCRSGDLIVEIARQDSGGPGGAILQRTVKPASDFSPTPAGFVTIALDTPVAVAAGDRLALVLRNVTGECALQRAPAGNTYPDGHGWFESAPEFAGWATTDAKGRLPGEPGDLPFQTFIDVPTMSDGGCFVPGFGPVPADPYSGACRCFQDPGGRETRCGGLHPDFLIERTIPFPLTPGKVFREVWRITPLTDLDGPVRMTLEGAGLAKPVYREFGEGGEPGVAETFTVKRLAPGYADDVEGLATFEYEMLDPADESFTFFGFDTSITKSDFEQ